jgi:sensor histidine kinase YesM
MSASPTWNLSLALIFGWRRVLSTVLVSALFALVLSPAFVTPASVLVGRALLAGLLALLAFGWLEQWPRRLPRWLARWVVQVLGVVFTVPLGVLLAYLLSTGGSLEAFWQSEARITGFIYMASSGLTLGVLMTMSALLRQRDEAARNQALAFELERSELERRALDARLRLLQAQVEPHFLFNTLANVRALVDAGSPQASTVLGSLIAYLRAAVPRLNQPATTLGEELALVRAYLELMHLRMPDRLQFSVSAAPDLLSLRCPTMTLLSLVENAIRHGIDPSEEGGRIDVSVERVGDRLLARVSDSGIGLRAGGDGLGTGLSTLRERLQLSFGGDAQLRLSERPGGGAVAEVEFPA